MTVVFEIFDAEEDRIFGVAFKAEKCRLIAKTDAKHQAAQVQITADEVQQLIDDEMYEGFAFCPRAGF